MPLPYSKPSTDWSCYTDISCKLPAKPPEPDAAGSLEPLRDMTDSFSHPLQSWKPRSLFLNMPASSFA